MNAFFLKVLLGCTLFLVSSIFTFANTSYSISPMRSELLLSPSTFSTWEVTLHNWWNEIKNFEVYFEECVKSGDAFNCWAYLSGWTVANSLSFWINIPEWKKYTISPNSSKKIQYSITIPSSVKGGSYFGVIKASEITGESNDLYIKSVVLWSSLLLTVNTDIQSSLDVWKPSISTSTLSIKFNIPVKNSWNVYLKPIGKIEIFDNNQLLQANMRKISYERWSSYYLKRNYELYTF